MISNNIKNKLLSKISDTTSHGVFILNNHLEYLWSNHNFGVMVGRPDNRIINSKCSHNLFEDLISEQQQTATRIRNSLAETNYYNGRLDILTGYRNTLTVQLTLWRIYLDDNTYYVGFMRHTDDKSNPNNFYSKLIDYDRVTGLPNRSYFLKKITNYPTLPNAQIYIVRLSLRNYKNLTRALSNYQLNTLLHQIVKRIDALAFDSLKLSSYFGSADFALLIEIPSVQRVNDILNAITLQFSKPFAISDHNTESTDAHYPKSFATQHIYVHLAVGVSGIDQNPSRLLRSVTLEQAEHALRCAEHSDKPIVYFDSFDQDIKNHALLDMQLESELRQALAEGQFIPVYQPKFNLVTNKIVGFEALVRWQHPKRGLLTPDSFIQAIIDYNLSFDLYQSMVSFVVKQLDSWAQLGVNTTVCVNTNAGEFRQPNFLNFTTALLERYNLAPQSLHLEITESSLMIHNATNLSTIEALREAGIGLALDDFGTGYASLSYLLHYPFDYLKLDKSFINGISLNSRQAKIVKAVISMAHDLNLEVIAEGIENIQQVKLLQKLGCIFGQGYYFGHPLTADNATQLLMTINR